MGMKENLVTSNLHWLLTPGKLVFIFQKLVIYSSGSQVNNGEQVASSAVATVLCCSTLLTEVKLASHM